ncbi:transposase [Ktedonospora formicarum]|uniref:transposase n=1 Tax=Ktedonospora formicarum TaxID=2778364 RepID=UPI001F19837D|nr:transposase [Ktedonospora formicarum]
MLEQGQLIKELRLLREHISQLESEIVTIVEQAREDQILLSSPGFGPITAATVIAAIGSIHNFPSASTLKSYFGWAPVVAQSGSTLDSSYLTPGGTRTMTHIMFLAVMQVIRLHNNEWGRLYERLVKARYPFDERTQSYTGKTRVIGRVAGQMIEAIYALLKRDAELARAVPQGQEPPPPLLYDPEVYQRHRQGHYRPLKSMPHPNMITIIHPSSLE